MSIRREGNMQKIRMLLGMVGISVVLNVAFANTVILDEDTVAVGDISEENEARGVEERKVRETYTNINGHQVMISCTTTRNQDGECRLFGECYPLFTLREPGNRGEVNYRDNGDNQVYDELQNLYRRSSGPCSNQVLESISKALGNPVSKHQYVCCPMERNQTRVERPTVSDPPTYQNQQCGKYFWRDAEKQTKSNKTMKNFQEVASTRIVNGRVAGRGEFPWTVAMMLNGRQICGGSLIDANHVLSAAHCVYFMNRADVKNVRLQIGDHNIYDTRDGPHETRGAANVYYHRAFSMRTLIDDVALIRLSNGVRFNRHIQPICLSTNSWAWEGQTATVAGWGQVSERGRQSSVLRTVNVDIWKQSQCSRTYQGKAPAGITNGMVCAGGRGSDSCKGDSGGPLNVWRNKRAEQVGIVSWGIGCGTYPGVYTRVDMYLNWINKNRR